MDRASALERRHDAGEQRHGVVVAVCELHPAADPRIQVAPLRDESRLPVTRRSRNQHHPAALHDLLQGSEAGPRHRIGPHGRNQHRRGVQQAPSLERRRRTSDRRDLRPCSTASERDPETSVTLLASTAARASGKACSGSEFLDAGHQSRPRSPALASGRTSATSALESDSGREYQPLWPMRDRPPQA